MIAEIPARVAAKILHSPWEYGETCCWLWLGCLEDGYGRVRFQGKMVLVHRLLYEIFVGPISEGMHIDHLCRVRSCCNPAHLEEVTPTENRRRALNLAFWAPKTHCPEGHEYTPENTWVYKTARFCKICHRTRSREFYRERRRKQEKALLEMDT